MYTRPTEELKEIMMHEAIQGIFAGAKRHRPANEAHIEPERYVDGAEDIANATSTGRVKVCVKCDSRRDGAQSRQSCKALVTANESWTNETTSANREDSPGDFH